MRFITLVLLLSISACQESFKIQNGNQIVVPETSWLKQLGFETMGANSAGTENCGALQVDSSGNMYCGGITSGSFAEANGGGTDALVIKFNSSGEILWSRQLGAVSAPGSTGTESIYSIQVDSTGNIYAVGYTAGALAEASAGGNDIFIAKLNSAGDVLWIKQLGAVTAPTATGNDYPNSLTLDPAGVLYISGQTNSSLFEANGGDYDAILIKMDSSGNILWGKQFGSVSAPGVASSGRDACFSIKYKSDSEIYCAGNTASSFGEANGGLTDMFLMKFNAAGVTSWIKQLGLTTMGGSSSLNDSLTGLDVDAAGNIYIGGASQGSLGEANGGDYDIVIVKLNSSGNLIWLKQLGAVTFPGGESSGVDLCLGLSSDKNGNVFCAGQTQGSLGETFGGGTNNAFILKMNSLGNLSWIKQIGSVTLPSLVQVTINSCRELVLYNGQPICSGRTNSNYVETNTANAGDIFLLKLKSDGTLDI